MVLQRLTSTVLATTILVFFSEKAFWYPQGYALFELLLFYSLPVYTTLWAFDYFHVRRLRTVILVGALYAFLVEGVLTPVIFEAGLLDPFMPAYFIGWHGLFSVVFGWFLLRRWLTSGRWGPIGIGSLLFGLLWGMWSITYWLPENAEEFARPVQWPVADFARHAFTFTLMLAVAHWLWGRIVRPETFRPGRLETGVVILVTLFFYATLSFPGAPLGLLKLGPLLLLVLLPLAVNRHRQGAAATPLQYLGGQARIGHLLFLLLMPLAATGVYAVASAWTPADEEVRVVQELFTFFQLSAGALLFLWAWTATLWPPSQQVAAEM